MSSNKAIDDQLQLTEAEQELALAVANDSEALAKQNKELPLLKGKTFSVLGADENARHVDQLIRSLGGQVVPIGTPGSYPLVSNSDESPLDGYSYDLIYYTRNHGELPSFERFRITKSGSNGKSLPSGPQSASMAAHTKINISPQAKVAPDQDDEDAINNRTGSFDVPKKRSAKFTPQEDEAILDLIRRNPYLRSTHSFYAQIAKLPLLSKHTGNSIRFRYRKVLSKRLDYVFVVDPSTGDLREDDKGEPIRDTVLPGLLKSQYTAKEDHDLCKTILNFRQHDNVMSRKRKMDTNSIPEQIFQGLSDDYPRHSAMSWRDRYRKFASVYGLQNYVHYYDTCLEEGKTPEPMKNLSSRNTSKKRKKSESVSTAATAAAIAAAATTDTENSSKIDDSTSTLQGIEELESVEHRQKTAEDLKKEQSANLFEDADEMKALNIDFTSSIEPRDNLMNLTLRNLRKAEPEPLANREDASADEILKDIDDAVGRFGSDIHTANGLVKAIHDKTGLSIAWLHFWFDGTSGSILPFLDVVRNYLKTGEVAPQNLSGFWTEEHDLMLKDKVGLDELYGLHGKESVERRQASIEGGQAS